MLRKALVLITFFLGLSFSIGLVVYKAVSLPQEVSLNTKGYPFLGKKRAELQFVVFEDFKCCNCKTFNEKVFPKIKEHYLDTGRAYYAFIPLAFLRGSSLLANAAYAVYAVSPERFFPFADALFEKCLTRDLEPKDLLEIAEAVGGIDIAFLQKAIETRAFYFRIDESMEMARRVMGGEIHTPILFINGSRTSTGSFESIQARVERILYEGV